MPKFDRNKIKQEPKIIDSDRLELPEKVAEIPRRAKSNTPKPKRFGWFRKKQEDVELTFATKHKQGKKRDVKKMITIGVLGLMVFSSLGAIGINLWQNVNVSKPEQIEQPDKELSDALSKLRTPEEAQVEQSNDSQEADKLQSDVDQKIKEGLEDATNKVVEEYNQKLETATKQVQEANSKASELEEQNKTLQREKETLQRQLDELKANTSNGVISGDTLRLPGE